MAIDRGEFVDKCGRYELTGQVKIAEIFRFVHDHLEMFDESYTCD